MTTEPAKKTFGNWSWTKVFIRFFAIFLEWHPLIVTAMKSARKSQLVTFTIRHALSVMKEIELLLNRFLPHVNCLQLIVVIFFRVVYLQSKTRKMNRKERRKIWRRARSSSMSGIPPAIIKWSSADYKNRSALQRLHEVLVLMWTDGWELRNFYAVADQEINGTIKRVGCLDERGLIGTSRFFQSFSCCK